MTQTKKYIILLLAFVLVNFLAEQTNFRWDFTKDHKYSLSKPTKNLLSTINQPISIKVYLEGDLPFDFEKLKEETNFFLKDFKTHNSQINYRFINPKNKEETLTKQGLAPSRLTLQENGKISESIIFPWAVIQSGKKSVLVNLLKNSSFKNESSQIESSIQNLEFAFATGIQKIINKKKKRIAILKGNGQLPDLYQYDFLKTIGQQYFLAPFTLDSVNKNPQKTLEQLQSFDMVIISKPTKPFSDAEKFTLDQYTINGGKSLWLVDMVSTAKDSLMQNGKALSYQRDLNLTDYLFNYGIRVNKHLVKDLYASKIPLAVGKVGNKTQFDEFLWPFYPLIKSKNNHVINKNIGDVKLEFINSIDTLKNNIKKTVLLESSKLTQTFNTPNYVELASITEDNSITNYNQGTKTLGVLLEGPFTSAYQNRIKPFKNNFKEKTNTGKMIFIADGDISSNQISKGKPLELGLDKWTKAYYANKEFLINAVDYLINDNELIQLKAKKIITPTIDRPKAFKEKLKWQCINILLPLFIILLIGLSNFYYRKTKY